MNIGYYFTANVKWDPETNEFADDTGDPAWLTREYRAPYSFG